MTRVSAAETERRRQEALAECAQEQPIKEMRQQFLGDLGYHEAMHAAYMLMENVEAYLLDHPCVLLDQQSYRLADQAHTALYNLYQRMGTFHLGK